MARARRALFGLAVVLLATGVAACGGDNDSSGRADPAPATTMDMGSMSTSPSSDPAAAVTTPTEGEAPMAATVDIADFTFMAADAHVTVGGTVTWVNQDSQQHTATGEGTFDTGAIAPGESVTVIFDEPGSFPYVCSFHPFMTGTVTVG